MTTSKDFELFATHQPTTSQSPIVHSFFDNVTSTWTYIAVDPASKQAIVFDPVLDYDAAAGKISTESAEGLVDFAKKEGYEIVKVIETHVHADHLTGSQAIKQMLSGSPQVYIGEKVAQVQKHFAPVYGISTDEFKDCFDRFLSDGEEFTLGDLKARVMALPGHTPDGTGILLGDCLFAGDSIFSPDLGTARVDFPGGDAAVLFNSIQKVLSLPEDVKVYSGHDYPDGRAKACMSLVSDHLHNNRHVKKGTLPDDFAKMRRERDAKLGTPRLLHAAMQVNLRAGHLPKPDANGHVYLKTPISGSLNGL